MSDDGQPTIDKLASEGISIRKCIASGEVYGSKSAPKSGGSAKPAKGALSGLRMKGGY